MFQIEEKKHYSNSSEEKKTKQSNLEFSRSAKFSCTKQEFCPLAAEKKDLSLSYFLHVRKY